MNLSETQDRIRWATLIILGGMGLLLYILDTTGNLDNAFNFVRNPMATLMEWTSDRTDILAGALAGPRDLQEAQQEIARLRARIDELERENELLQEYESEARLLRELFDQARASPELRRVSANVIGRDTSPVIRSIVIDKGTDHGVYPGMPVEASRGLVGRVYRSTTQTSQVLLITDSSSRIPARLGDSRATGILGGAGGGSLVMDWINLETQVEINELVLTSGIGGGFPPNLTIGRVIEIDRREAALHQQVHIQPVVNFESLEIVLVITNFTPVDPFVFDGGN